MRQGEVSAKTRDLYTLHAVYHLLSYSILKDDQMWELNEKIQVYEDSREWEPKSFSHEAGLRVHTHYSCILTASTTLLYTIPID